MKIPTPTERVGVIYIPWESWPPTLKITPRTQNIFCVQLNTHNGEGIRKGRAWQLQPLVWLRLLCIWSATVGRKDEKHSMRVEVDYISPCCLLSLFHCFPLPYLKDYMKKRRLGQSEPFSVLTFQVTDSEEQLYPGSYWTCLPLSALPCQMQVDNFINTELSL